MKKFHNKDVKIEIPGGPAGKTIIKKKRSELIEEVLNYPPEGGFSVSEMTHRMKILKDVKKANGEIKLEDSDFNKLRDLIKVYRWRFLSQDIIEFCETIILMK